jgi:hypothetical protein
MGAGSTGRRVDWALAAGSTGRPRRARSARPGHRIDGGSRMLAAMPRAYRGGADARTESPAGMPVDLGWGALRNNA